MAINVTVAATIDAVAAIMIVFAVLLIAGSSHGCFYAP